MYTDKDIEEAKAFIKERVKAEIAMQNHLDELLIWAAKEIVAIAYKYKIKASLFRFSANKQLEAEVNEVIKKLRQKLYMAAETLSVNVDDKQQSNIIAFINAPQYGKTLKERINTYTNRYKYEIEAFVAAGLLARKSTESLLAAIKQDLAAPYNNKLFKQSILAGSLMATRIKSNGVSYGTGHATSSRNMLNILSRNIVAAAWMYIYGQVAKSKGAIGFYSFRGSSYPCAHCDDMVGYHPIEEYKGYWHPNCRCYFVFVYQN